jgi:hypothetical protein
MKALACLVLVVGCSAPDARWQVETPELVPAFRAAAALWCEQTEGAYCPELGDSDLQAVHEGEAGSSCATYREHAWPLQRRELIIDLARFHAGRCPAGPSVLLFEALRRWQ